VWHCAPQTFHTLPELAQTGKKKNSLKYNGQDGQAGHPLSGEKFFFLADLEIFSSLPPPKNERDGCHCLKGNLFQGKKRGGRNRNA